jgi:hypothetical protein
MAHLMALLSRAMIMIAVRKNINDKPEIASSQSLLAMT